MMIDKIFCGDCLEVMKDIPDDSVDMILTDLPYGVTACDWDVVIPFEPMWGQFLRIAKKNAAIVLTATNPFAAKLINSQIELFKQELIWFKSQGTGFLNANKMFLKSHENILIFSKNLPAFHPIMNKGKAYSIKSGKRSLSVSKDPKITQGGWTTENKGERYPVSVLKFNSVHNPPHPTQKPVPLFQYLIQTYTQENEIVLDCCAGSGTTGVAARNCNRRFILIEQEFKYCRIARERIGLEKTKIIRKEADDETNNS